METLSFLERHVADFAKAGAVVVQRTDMAPVYLIGTVPEVISAVGHQPGQHGVDLDFGGDECVQRGVVGIEYNGPRVGMTTRRLRACLRLKFNWTRNTPRTSGSSRVGWLSHGGNRNDCKPLECQRPA